MGLGLLEFPSSARRPLLSLLHFRPLLRARLPTDRSRTHVRQGTRPGRLWLYASRNSSSPLRFLSSSPFLAQRFCRDASLCG